MKEIVKIVEDITKFEDLREFATAQYHTLIVQSKKIQKLQEENDALRLSIEKYKMQEVASSSLDTSKGVTNDAETTCLVQLAVLKGKAMLCELTLEETKKVEIYAKTLNLIKSKKSEDSEEKEALKHTDTKELLLLISGKTQEQ